MAELKVIPLPELYKIDYSLLRIVPFYHCWRDGNSFTTPEGGRPNSGLMYFADCETEYTLQHRLPFAAIRGDLSYVPQAATYTCRFRNCAVRGRSNEHLINFELFDDAGQPFVLASSVQVFRPRDTLWYARRFEEILQLFHHSEAPAGQIKALVFTLLTDLSLEQRKEHLSAGRYARIAPAILYVDQHFAEDLAVRNLAERCHLSESHFRRLFHACTGMSPLDYVIDLRIGKARLLLESGSASVAEAAESVGYADPSYFSRVFRYKTGIRPRDLLKLPVSQTEFAQ